MDEQQVNLTIVPESGPDDRSARLYANFCAIAHTPFDFTLTFCEVMPLSDQALRDAQADRIVRAPVRARVVLPVQSIPALIGALQEHLRVYAAAQPPTPPPQSSDPVH